MHGMINRGLQSFVHDHYGAEKWEETCLAAGLPFYSFESMLQYEDEMTASLLETLSIVLKRSKTEILEDFGTYVVTNARLDGICKLLKFGGETYREFLHSLDDVYERLKIAMPTMEVPKLIVEERSRDRFILHYEFSKPGYGAVLLGVLRGMADDYGALVVIDRAHVSSGQSERDRFDIRLADENWNPKTEIRRQPEIRKLVG